jgi:hypothetical protein
MFTGQAGSSSLATVPESAEQRPHGQLVYKIVFDPPNMQAWREKLFNVDDTITLTNDECALSKLFFSPNFGLRANTLCCCQI